MHGAIFTGIQGEDTGGQVAVHGGAIFEEDRSPPRGSERRLSGAGRSVWCRDSTGWFLPVMSQKRHMLPLFSGLTLFLAFAVHRWSWRGPRPTWLCGSFSGQTKPGSQSLTHRKPVRTIEVTLDRSASWQAEVRRLLHLVAGDEEGAAVQWGT